MREILVPTDFSENAEHALDYIFPFAEAVGADIRLHHVIEPHVDPAPSNVKLLEDRLYQLADLMRERHGFNGKISYETSHGNLPENMGNRAISGNAWLIAMGTKGASGLKEMFVGSNTVKLMDHVKKPVLVIPEQAEFNPLQNILYSTDYKAIKNDDALDIIKEIAMAFDAEVRLAHVKSNHTMASEDKVLERHRQGHIFDPEVKYSYKVIYDKNGVVHGINYYIRKKGDNDMVAMINRKHGLLRQTFLENRTQEMAYHTKLPLLVIPES